MPTNRKQLAQAMDAAFDRYVSWLEDRCREMGLVIGVDIGGIEQMENKVGVAKAKTRYAEAQAEMDQIGAAYGLYHDAPELARQAHETYYRAVHNAKAGVVAAKHWYDNYQGQVDKINNGELAKYGITVPDASELDKAAKAKMIYEESQQELTKTEQEAALVLDAELARLEGVRPGATDSAQAPAPETSVASEAKASAAPSKPSKPKPDESDRKRVLVKGLRSYKESGGPLTEKDLPRMRPLRRHFAFLHREGTISNVDPRITVAERNAIWPHV